MYDQQMAVKLSGDRGIGLADVIAKQLGPKQKPDDNNKMQLGDYLNRALGGQGQVTAQPLTRSSHVNARQAGELKPMDESGLNRLQQNLDRLEKARQANAQRWQALDGDWAGAPAERSDVASNKHMFMDNLLPHARQAARELGVDANLLLAQAALETGWGQSVIKNNQGDSSFNLFNIKADKSWQGKQAKVTTLEYDGDVTKKTMAGFRSYDSYKDSFDDYVNFIKSNPRYSDALKKAGSPAHYIRELQQAGYATDPRYAEKVMSIYRSQIAGQMPDNAG